ncbi:uncharacterized protein LOC111640935 [Centruroides sculpturatus]|uniref:uncharacterized protein LOC111640935 n=1 Tax=Centruroides sculpturatus TaxID=218467 RepID=UPI000C6EE602|nr:uncharacterized protein LOC111640935 [Centruroides sculpturatus]
MPEEEEAVPSWFRMVEVILETYEVSVELQGQIVLSVLSEKCKAALTRLSADKVKHYPSLKEFILEELRLSPAEYLKGFRRAERYPGETWPQFVSRLKDLYQYYVDSREVETLEGLVELTVADHIKTLLPHDARKYVILQEGKGWSKPAELARFVEKFDEASSSRSPNKSEENGEQRDSRRETKGKSSPVMQTIDEQPHKIGCYVCGKTDHWRRNCPKRKAHNEPKQARLVATSNNSQDERRLVARVTSYDQPKVVKALNRVRLACEGNCLSAIVDSGAEISVIRESLVPTSVMGTKGRIQLVGPFGHWIDAVLVSVPIGLWEEDFAGSRSSELVTCALTDELDQTTDALLSEEDYRMLLNRKEKLQEKGERQARSLSVDGNGNHQEKEPEPLAEAGRCGISDEKGKGTELRDTQVPDESLSRLWEVAEPKEDGLVVENRTLYRQDSSFGRPIKQIVVPQERRTEVLDLAHKAPCGGQFGSRVLASRVRESFYWLGMVTDIRKYCQNSRRCQVSAPDLVLDRTPATPLARSSTPFQVVNIGVVVPIDHLSANGHRYAVCVISLRNRLSEVEEMRSLVTRLVFLRFFTQTGFPEMICYDQGTNFTVGLTREMTRMLEVENVEVARIKSAHDIATKHTAVKREGYAVRSNLEARKREYNIGDTVLVEKSSPDDKLHVRWEWPDVVEKRSFAVRIVLGFDGRFGELDQTSSLRPLYDRGRGDGRGREIPPLSPTSAQTELDDVPLDYNSMFDNRPKKKTSGHLLESGSRNGLPHTGFR